MIGRWNEDRVWEEIAHDDEDEEDEGEVNEEVSEYEKRERSFGGGQWASWGSALLLQQLCNEIQTFADKCSRFYVDQNMRSLSFLVLLDDFTWEESSLEMQKVESASRISVSCTAVHRICILWWNADNQCDDNDMMCILEYILEK